MDIIKKDIAIREDKIERYIKVRMGRKWFRIDLFEIIAAVSNKSKNHIKQLANQDGLEIWIEQIKKNEK